MIDFTKKIKNSDKFRLPALLFIRTGSYCLYPKGTAEYMRFWNDEMSKCIDGYTADDGDFISGYNYFYLNYCPINRTVNSVVNGEVVSELIVTFPDFWDYDYYYFTCVDQAKLQGKHLCVLKSRRKGYSYKGAAMLCRNYYLIPNSKSYVYASNKLYLTDDGILTKAWDYLDFIDEHTAWGKKRSVNTLLRKRAGMLIKDEYGNQIETGYKSEIIGVTLKDNPDVGHSYDLIIYTPEGKKTWEEIKEGSIIFNTKGGTTTVTEVNELGTVGVYKVYLNDGRVVEATEDHKWRIFKYGYCKKNGKEQKALREYTLTTKLILELTNNKSYKTNKCRIKHSISVPFNHLEVPIDAYTLGLLLGDGCLGKTSKHKALLTQLPEDLYSIQNYIPYEISTTGDKKGITFHIHIPNIKDTLRELSLIDKTYTDKFVPDIYKYNSEEVRLGIINGLLDTDGCVSKDYGVIEYSSKSPSLAKDMQWLLHSVGINSKITTKEIKGEIYYRVWIYCRADEQRLFNMPRKKERIKIKNLNEFALSKTRFNYIERVEYIGEKRSKCITVDADDSAYLVGDFVLTKNCRGKKANLILFEEAGSFKELGAAWLIARPSVENDGVAFATMIAFGTGGDEGSNFATLKNMFYNPKGYNCLELENIWDENVDNTKCGFFIPLYTNMDIRDENGKRIYMDEDGNTVRKASLNYVLEQRKDVIENATSSVVIDRYVAERCITPAEACLDFNGNIFPKKELQEQLAKIRTNKKLTNHKQVGDLIWDADGSVKWVVKKQGDITHYPLNKDDDPTGAIVIWEHPVKDAPVGLYILGVDPYDHDQSGTNSLGSTFVYKRFLNFENYYDIIVAEYTGRPPTAEEYYENLRKLAVYYNGRIMYENERKGLFPYFTAKHCDYLLADQPDIISDIVGNSKVQRKKGCHMNKLIKQWGEGLIKDWLNDEKSPGHKNLHEILSEPLLEELIAYNDVGNFDRCICKDTKITTLLGYKAVQDITTDDYVFTDKGVFLKVVWTDLHTHSGKSIKLRLVGDYRELECTDNHPILVAYTDKKKHKYRKDALKNILFLRADLLNYKYLFNLLPKRKLQGTLGLADELLYTLGWIMADGHVSPTNNGITIVFLKNLLECANRCKLAIEDYLSDEKEYIIKDGRKLVRKEVVIKDCGNYYRLIVHSIKLHSLALRFGCLSNNKKIADNIYNTTCAKTMLPFIIGYFEGDGHLRLNVNYDGYRRNGIELSTIYEELLLQVRQILLDNGIWSSVRKVKNCKLFKQQYSILISNEYVTKLLNSYKSSKFINLNIIKATSKVLETEDGFWTPIKLVETKEITDTVYNFEVENDHTYVANGIVTHNCMAMMQVMIYREQLYNVVVKDKKKNNRERLLFDGPLFMRDYSYDDSFNQVDEDVYTFN